ncbi:MAG: ABC transporter ATP-binding protein [Burkholderiaceae bacterium]|nr:ABC transporter ATP-binding protein [Burkholderiaceae bacterium]
MLEVKDLAVTYGQHRALKGVSLTVAPGEIVVILGANGAGKTSLLKAIAGLERGAGSVRLDGSSIAGLPPHRIVEAGLALVPEGRGIFGDLTVQENLALGAFAHRARDGQQANLDRVLGLFTRLSERSGQVARTMSGGEQQMVAIGRALMSAPTILMLDEPSLGLSPLLCTELFRNLRTIRDSGVGVLLVEQNARQSLAIADRAYLLENGEIVGQGPAAQLARDPAVQAAYLGGAAGHAAAPAASTPAPAHASARRRPQPSPRTRWPLSPHRPPAATARRWSAPRPTGWCPRASPTWCASRRSARPRT